MANNLHVVYDLMTPGQDYSAVEAKIKELGGWAKLNQSVWYVDSLFTAAQARDHIKTVLDPNDKLYVVNATANDAAWSGLSDVVGSFVRDSWTK